MLSMGFGLGLSSRVEDQHHACTSITKKPDCCNKNLPYYIEKPRWMWKREMFDWDGIYQYAKYLENVVLTAFCILFNEKKKFFAPFDLQPEV